MTRSSTFTRELGRRNPDPRGRRWLFVPYDQLSDAIGPLSREDPAELGIVLLECPWKAARRPYHKQKLALVLANLRHFALEQSERGVAVDHRVAPRSYGNALRSIAREKGGLRCMRPAELELRRDLEPLVEEGLVELVPHEGWLTTTEQFRASQEKGPPWRMDAFYRRVRRDGGWLMDGRGKPLGGKFSFDTENRESWSGEPPPAEPPEFPPDAVTQEVAELVEERFASHPGALDLAALPASRRQAAALWSWARRKCLPLFGPFEDAMSTRTRTLFHTRVSALLHLHRLLPRRVVEDVCALDVELRSKEGFVRQVVGWREFMRHVHEQTDGFRRLPGASTAAKSAGGADPSFLESRESLPAAYWGEPSGLACLDEVVRSVWEEGYSHHITRLMVLSNIATLLDVSPRELTDWFWVAYVDAYDWVVEPNVLAMGTFGVGDLLTTKPYVSGAAYIHRMSDYCSGCAFDPRRDCPITPLYWAFLERHRGELAENPRLRMPYASLRKRSEEKRRRDRAVFEHVRTVLGSGEHLAPGALEGAADR
jgi:deoxyribodipyrimidine photolyase-related protein